MPEVLQQPEQDAQILDRVLHRLKELHTESTEDRNDLERIQSGMIDLMLGAITLEAKQALVALRTQSILEVADRNRWTSAQLAEAIIIMRQEVTERMFEANWFESTLSTTDFQIHAATYGTNMFRFDLRKVMAENPSLERLEGFAWIMFDVRGLRSFKDCTSHQATTLFLQEVARIFVDPQGPTRQRLEGQGITVIPMATGGDEFELYLRSHSPIRQELIDQVIASFQQEISSSAKLRASLNFDDPTVLLQYGFPSIEQRQEFNGLPPEQRDKKRQAIRTEIELKEYIPIIDGGGCNLRDGILYAVDKDPNDLRAETDFSPLRNKIVQGTTDCAKDQQEENKRRDKKKLARENPALSRFHVRGEENRLKEQQIQKLDELITMIRTAVETLLRQDQEQVGEELPALKARLELFQTQLTLLLQELPTTESMTASA